MEGAHATAGGSGDAMRPPLGTLVFELEWRPLPPPAPPPSPAEQQQQTRTAQQAPVVRRSSGSGVCGGPLDALGFSVGAAGLLTEQLWADPADEHSLPRARAKG
eukprot:181779-Prymnesium_polylepis.1